MPWTFRDIEPQKARGYIVPSIWESPIYIADVKEDGDRRVAQFCGGVVRFTGCMSPTTGKVVEKSDRIPHLSAVSVAMPGGGAVVGISPPEKLDGTVLDGEIVTDGPAPRGGRSKFVTRIMGSKAALAVAKQQATGWLHYRVFDCLWFKGDDIRKLSLDMRRMRAEEAVAAWGNQFASMIKHTLPGQDKKAFYNEIIRSGGEGVVLKSLHHRYGDEKLWVKVKHEATADCVIMGFAAAEVESTKADGTKSATKYFKAGLIGAIRLGQYRGGKLMEVATVSGMTDSERKMFSRTPNAFIGKVAEIKHNGREPTMRFRHPRFRFLRMEKDPAACRIRPNEV
jgi:ATP-dependent DNA ligase